MGKWYVSFLYLNFLMSSSNFCLSSIYQEMLFRKTLSHQNIPLLDWKACTLQEHIHICWGEWDCFFFFFLTFSWIQTKSYISKQELILTSTNTICNCFIVSFWSYEQLCFSTVFHNLNSLWVRKHELPNMFEESRSQWICNLQNQKNSN